MSLTTKQETFCQNVIKGMSYKDAYIDAYNSKGSDQNAYNEGSKLMLREDIQERLKVLRKPLEDVAKTTAITDREKKRNFLWEVIHDETQAMSDRLRAVDLLAKIDQEYTNVNVNKTESTLTLEGLDLTALKTLSE